MDTYSGEITNLLTLVPILMNSYVPILKPKLIKYRTLLKGGLNANFARDWQEHSPDGEDTHRLRSQCSP
jgi:hypothetical protein